CSLNWSPDTVPFASYRRKCTRFDGKWFEAIAGDCWLAGVPSGLRRMYVLWLRSMRRACGMIHTPGWSGSSWISSSTAPLMVAVELAVSSAGRRTNGASANIFWHTVTASPSLVCPADCSRHTDLSSPELLLLEQLTSVKAAAASNAGAARLVIIVSPRS